MSKLKAQRAGFVAHRRASSTQRALASDWKQFSEWCINAGRKPLPATGETVELFLTHCVTELGHKVATLTRRVWAIAQMHRQYNMTSPVGEGARDLINSVARVRGAKPRQKRALTIDELRRMVATLDDSARGRRDRAILLLGFSTGMRRSEIAGLQVADLAFSDRGVVVSLARAKNDQRGFGRAIGVLPGADAQLCAVAALRGWLKARGAAAGPLFGVTGEWIADIVKDRAAAVGLDPKHYAAHSLRAGMVTALDAGGVGLPAIMQRSGHKSVAMVLRYVRNSEIFTADPLSLAPRAS